MCSLYTKGISVTEVTRGSAAACSPRGRGSTGGHFALRPRTPPYARPKTRCVNALFGRACSRRTVSVRMSLCAHQQEVFDMEIRRRHVVIPAVAALVAVLVPLAFALTPRASADDA